MSNVTDASRAKLLSLTEISGIGDKRALEMVETVGDIDAVFKVSNSAFSELHYVTEDVYEALQNLDDTVHQYVNRIQTARESGISLITPLDEKYPDQFRNHHSPLQLFLKGNEDLLNSPTVSFAGSRDANDEAVEWTTKLSSSLVDAGYCIVSGGAFGVDKAAHQAALDAGGNTILVSPSGHNKPYPKAHEELYKDVEQRGLVISHRFPDQKPARGGFIYRNKTNSAIGDAIVIAAAGDDGGSMAQYNIANDQGTDVFVPSEDVGALPDEGLAQMRSDDDSVIITDSEKVIQMLNDTRGQSSLDNW